LLTAAAATPTTSHDPNRNRHRRQGRENPIFCHVSLQEVRKRVLIGSQAYKGVHRVRDLFRKKRKINTKYLPKILV